MKPIHKNTHALRQQILKSAVASFKIEGIKISADTAIKALKKIEAKMAKSSQ
ncbi:hypothetical protein [Chryseobacterium herbae]|uniref:Uncharacterized protein n=1 Tax=Chryseobacterium herbae TaxID=2976476 RepID=A0ABT2ISV5_9FLAO|nr:hypothetical protein [Chryseobacterium sp. pc1-10]MCT2561903.1 hypothetical protein [Chryseobacterium sp. pc1-10]